MREFILFLGLIYVVSHLDDFDRILRNAGRCEAASPAVPLAQ